jgi:alpha 1,2-mannosyltransferase
MRENRKKYGFIITVHEEMNTVETLWPTTKNFMKKYPNYIAKDNFIHFVEDMENNQFNGCHFWSNFEIVDLSFYRSREYLAYFDFLDKAGGFYYERWGDASVHSIAASILLNRHEIHYFSEMAYAHDEWMYCPTDADVYRNRKCFCNQNDGIQNTDFSCSNDYIRKNRLVNPDIQ